ncbi:MAG: nucleic acid-binding protein [Nitrospirae bacterium]|nr:MAG: nucleic acid-binding protein [Nitrospirota bacterium]
MPEIIFDCCVLSNFALSGSLHIIKKLYANSSYLTNFVAAENLRGILSGHNKLASVNETIKEGWIKEIALKGEKEKALFTTLSVSLGFGESSSIAIAKTRGYIFACDDRAARREADLLAVKLTGTIGIIIKTVKKKVISSQEADVILNHMIASGFYSPVSSIKNLL